CRFRQRTRTHTDSAGWAGARSRIRSWAGCLPHSHTKTDAEEARRADPGIGVAAHGGDLHLVLDVLDVGLHPVAVAWRGEGEAGTAARERLLLVLDGADDVADVVARAVAAGQVQVEIGA